MSTHIPAKIMNCENHEYFELYIREIALYDQSHHNGVTHIIISEDETELLGFVTLRATSLLSQDKSGLIGEPALEISNLAVAGKWERHGIGRLLISNVLALAYELSTDQIGIKYILLRADPKSVGFYKKNGFEEAEPYYFNIPLSEGNRLCVPMMMVIPE